mmetsp:Transcript_41870/g.96877  ORF Transcript_41870/g.96877 Transcript_41870/m.96877 type:complete len:212 (-) Transcript_41870:1789-2424(-)
MRARLVAHALKQLLDLVLVDCARVVRVKAVEALLHLRCDALLAGRVPDHELVLGDDAVAGSIDGLGVHLEGVVGELVLRRAQCDQQLLELISIDLAVLVLIEGVEHLVHIALDLGNARDSGRVGDRCLRGKELKHAGAEGRGAIELGVHPRPHCRLVLSLSTLRGDLGAVVVGGGVVVAAAVNGYSSNILAIVGLRAGGKKEREQERSEGA